MSVRAVAETVRCCLCDSPAVATWHMPQGCVARPDLTTQPLCLHHSVRAAPLGGMTLALDHTVDGQFSRWWGRP